MRLQTQSLLPILTAFLLILPFSAQASEGAFMTGKTLVVMCSSKKTEDQFACQNYIAGVIDYHRLIRSMGSAPTVDFCIPDTVKMADIQKIVTLYIQTHSEHQDFIAAPGVAMAMYIQFPCKKKRR